MYNTTIAVVQCGGRKLSHAALARDLYTGPLFTACKRAAERIAVRWYIASAKHGLVSPTKPLSPYNTTLPDGGDPAWGSRVLCALRQVEPEGWGRLVVLASSRYLVGWAEEAGAECPLVGLPIGKAIQAANRAK